MKRRRGQFSGSMDSLLDTMTNVVGILVILLIVTQLGVGEAVDRIRENLPEVSVEEHEQAQAANRNLRDLLENAQRDDDDAQRRLSERERRLESLRSEIAELRIDDESQDVADLGNVEDELSALQTLKSELEERIPDMEEQMRLLRAQASEIGPPPEPIESIIRIPDPRAAPDGAGRRWIFCRGGRIIYVDIQSLRGELARRIQMHRRILLRTEGDSPLASIRTQAQEREAVYDRTKIIDYFERNPIQIGGHRFRFHSNPRQRVVFPVINPSPREGFTVHDIQRPMSSYRRLLQEIKRDGDYIRFVVYPDSFEAYLEARAIAEEKSVPAGWVLQTGEEVNVWGTAVPGINVHREEEPEPRDGTAPQPRPVID